MLMWILIASLAQAKSGPSPLDAFRANHADVKAEMDFVMTSGKIDSSFIRNGTIWSAEVIPISDEQKDRTIEGTWACDGAAEYYYCGSPDAAITEKRAFLAKNRPSGPEIQLGYKPKVEGIFDGDVMAEHVIDELVDPFRGDISVRKNGNDVLYTQGKGPYSWWECTFPYYLSYRFPDTAPRIVQLNRGPAPVDVEVYTKEIGKARLRLEVGYDPAVGYVPRHTRLISRTAEGKTFVRETYAVKIDPCKAGGFVPTEWYIAHFDFDDFDSRYPDYDEAVNLAPAKSSVYVEHFRATRFQDRANPVALVRLAGVNALVATGGTVKLQKGVDVLTMSNIKAKLGRRLTQVVSDQLPSIDASELHEFDRSASPFWPWAMAIAVILVLSGVNLRRLIRKRRTVQALICLAPLMTLGGCSGQAPSAVSLSGRVDPPIFLFDSENARSKMKLLVRNGGTKRLDLLRVEGDCSCRQIDQSGFPMSLEPNEEAAVFFNTQHGPASQIVSARFTFESPHGAIPVFTTFHPLAKHQFSPDSAAHNSIVENEPWSFDLTHRHMYKTNHKPEPVAIKIPPEVTMKKVSTHEGLVAGAEGYSYTDETYRVDVISREKGLHRTDM